MRALLALLALALGVDAQNLKTVHLPAGGVPGFDVGWDGWNGSAQRTKYPNPRTERDPDGEFYDGIRFVGAGRAKTHILVEAPMLGWVGSGPAPVLKSAGATIYIGKGCGIVEFEALTIHCASEMGVGVGEHWDQTSPLEPQALRMTDVAVITDPPRIAGLPSTKWGVHTLQTDIDFERVLFDVKYSAEHALYAHGFYHAGIEWNRVTVYSVGAEGLKVATRPDEVAFVPNAAIIVRDSLFQDWKQPWSHRGGAGAVLQGSGARWILFDRCQFYGGEKTATRSLMIDDGGGRRARPDGTIEVRFYDMDGGTTGNGPANGSVIIRRCGFTSGAGVQSFSDVVRVGPIATHPVTVAESVSISQCGFFGERTKVGIYDVPEVTVERCNTPRLTAAAAAAGVDVEHSAALHLPPLWIPSIAAGGVVPQEEDQ